MQPKTRDDYGKLPTGDLQRRYRNAEERSRRADADGYMLDAYAMQEIAAALTARGAAIPNT